MDQSIAHCRWCQEISELVFANRSKHTKEVQTLTTFRPVITRSARRHNVSVIKRHKHLQHLAVGTLLRNPGAAQHLCVCVLICVDAIFSTSFTELSTSPTDIPYPRYTLKTKKASRLAQVGYGNTRTPPATPTHHTASLFGCGTGFTPATGSS